MTDAATLLQLRDVALEWDVLASVTYDPRVLPAVMREVTAADFSSQRTSAVFEAVKRAAQDGGVDAAAVARELVRAGADRELMLELFDAVHVYRTVPANAPRHARQLHAFGLMRRLAAAGQTITELAVPSATPEEVITRATAMLRALGEDLPTREQGVEDLVTETEQHIERTWREDRVLRTGLPTLDRKLDGGLWPGRLYVVGARPGVGKSAFLSAVASRALNAGKPVLFMSLEMSGREVLTRMVVESTGVDPRNETALLSEMYGERVHGWPLHFITVAAIDAVTARVRELSRELGLFVVDYLQLIPSRGRGRQDTREREIAEFSREMKVTAMECQVPVLVASQVNRQPMGRGDRTPRLSDLRESGAIENDADIVMLLHRDVDRGERRGYLTVAKNRHGDTGELTVHFDSTRMRFVELT